MAGEGQLAGFLSDGANMIIRSALLQVGLWGLSKPALLTMCCTSMLQVQRLQSRLLPPSPSGLHVHWSAQAWRHRCPVAALCAFSEMLPAVFVSTFCWPACRPPFSWPLQQRLASAQLRWLPTR